MLVLKTGDKKVKLSKSSVVEHNLGEYDLEGGVDESKGEVYFSVIPKASPEDAWTLIDCVVRGDELVLYHLESEVSGEDFGKLGLALFWGIAMELGLESYAMRFGGGHDSESWLKHLRFPEEHISRMQHSQTEGDYTVVVGRGIEKGRIVPVNFSEFPTGFFEAERL